MNESSTPIAEGVQKLVNNIQVNIVENGRESVVNYIPHLEIEFESEVAAYDFYNEYNKKMGFGIRREYGNKSKVDGILTSRRFTCFKEGNRGVYKQPLALNCSSISPSQDHLIGNASQHGTAYQQGAARLIKKKKKQGDASQHGIEYQHGAASLHLNLSESENRIQQVNTLGMYNFF
ncbi:protein FAR1-RELATED SEQUENCE [Trifolium repens]|nr:protein FAR1-RELATED SEQUENCE [Trifolium repens]